MWKIGAGYALLLLWCYIRAELHYRRRVHAAPGGMHGLASDTLTRLRALSWAVMAAAIGLVVWGSGLWSFLWFPGGLILAAFIQTLVPLKDRWR